MHTNDCKTQPNQPTTNRQQQDKMKGSTDTTSRNTGQIRKGNVRANTNFAHTHLTHTQTQKENSSTDQTKAEPFYKEKIISIVSSYVSMILLEAKLP